MNSDAVLTGPLVLLDRDECLALLRRGRVGRLAVVVKGQPHVIPLNYAADESGIIVFRTAEFTTAAQASLSQVAFEVDEIDLEHQTGSSVVVHGYGRDITDAIDLESQRLRQLPVLPWASGERDQWFKITPSEITGRRLAAAASRS
jgi:nitroimidazol reductase NimA-like FMN-containing flavoprotein (pyridoxamine 5'-phosphate oxidase superfamily)